jgi:DNA-binding protein H-NS
LIIINDNIAHENNQNYSVPAKTGYTKGITMTELNSMSLDQLKKLKKDIDKAITSFEARRISEARKALEAKAAELGVSLSDILGATPAKRAKAAVAAKYAHPENSALSWSGRGRRPQWIIELEAKGGNRADYAIS